jgi:4-carboxymuconolactone decarboxylase
MRSRRPAPEKCLGTSRQPLVHFTDDVLFGEVWKRPDLAPRDRSHLAFYTGWPQAMAAMAVAKQVFAGTQAN